MSMKLKERLTSLPLFVLFALAFYYSRRFPKVPKMLPTALSILGLQVLYRLASETEDV